MYKFLFILKLIIVLPVMAAVDPTKPLSGYSAQGKTHVVGEKPLVLEAIIHGDKIHTAVINNTTLKVGDTIREHRLVAVNDDSVVLRTADETIKLYIFSGVIAK